MASAAMERGAPLSVTGAWMPILTVVPVTPRRVAPGDDGRVPLVVLLPPLADTPAAGRDAVAPVCAPVALLAAGDADGAVVLSPGVPAWMPELTWVWPPAADVFRPDFDLP